MAASIAGCGGKGSTSTPPTATPSASASASASAKSPIPTPTPAAPTPTPAPGAQTYLYAADSLGMQIITFKLKGLAPGSTGTTLTSVPLASAAPSTSIPGLLVDPAGKQLFYQLHFAGAGFLVPSVMDVEGCVLKILSGVLSATCAAEPALSASLSPTTQGGDALFGGGIAWGSAGLFVASTFAQSGSAPSYNTGTVEAYPVTTDAGLNTSSPLSVASVKQPNAVNGPNPVLAPAYTGVAVDPYENAATANTAPSPGASPGQIDLCTPGPPYACSVLLPNINYPIAVAFDLFGDLYTLVAGAGGASSLERCVGQSGTINPSTCTSTSLGSYQATAMTVDNAGNAYVAVTAPQSGILVISTSGKQTLAAAGLKADITALAVGP